MEELQLIIYPNPILLKKSETVELTTEIKKFCLDMEEFYRQGLTWGKPVGLAAPQVGKNWRIFIVLGEIFINPEILWTPNGPKTEFLEGCYSLEQGKFDYKVSRPYSVTLKWTDLNGETHTKRFKGNEAQIILHEFDHLEGKLCCGESYPQPVQVDGLV